MLVDFGASWCPPCKQMEPILQNISKELAGKFTLLKVDGGKDDLMNKIIWSYSKGKKKYPEKKL